MDRTLDGIFGLIGVVLTAVITTWKDEIGLFLKGKLSANKDLEARWTATWTKSPLAGGKESAEQVKDVVRIERVSGDKITATGENADAGTYRITGRILPSSVLTFSWTGDGEKQFLGGVAVVELDIKRTKMIGHWCQVTEDRKFVGGEVHLKKQATSG
jgi:hypothetical protein